MRTLQGRYFRLRAVKIFTARKRKFLHRNTVTKAKSLYKIQYISGNFCIHIKHHQCLYNKKYYFLYLTYGLYSNNSRDFCLRSVNSPIACKQKYQNWRKITKFLYIRIILKRHDLFQEWSKTMKFSRHILCKNRDFRLCFFGQEL